MKQVEVDPARLDGHAEHELALAEGDLFPREISADTKRNRARTLPKKKRVAISYASREVTRESGPPWHLCTNVRVGGPRNLEVKF